MLLLINNIKNISYLCIAAIGGILAFPANATPLSPPFDVTMIREKAGALDKRHFACGEIPAPLRDLFFESKYQKGDDSHSMIDPKAEVAYKAAYAGIEKFEQSISSMANRYVLSKPPRSDIATCAFDWLYAWAKADALLGKANPTGELVRKWALCSLANTWLQVSAEPSFDQAKNQKIQQWILDIAKTVVADFSRNQTAASRQSNHLYWAAWGVASAGIALNDNTLFGWAMNKARFGIEQIQHDGTLPLELARGNKAFTYHLFSAMPLFFLAEAGDRNGIDLFGHKNRSLKKLGDLCLQNLENPAYIKEKVGVEQDMTRAGTPSNMGWVEIYAQHSPNDSQAQTVLKKLRPMKQSRMGGNISLLYAQWKAQ